MEITLSTAGLPPGVTMKLKNIPAKQNAIKQTLTLTPKAKVGKAAITLTSKAKYQGRDVIATSPPVTLTIKK
ncbi:MAG TPA: hypothetical protein VMG10_31725 [Gemmataceae bacterium]|nr:hypothetical protein [Gemmataceae bacterium]